MSVDNHLARTRERLQRVGPLEADALVRDGALLVDIRPAAQRKANGEIPDALIIERNVLEWRLDPEGAHRIGELRGAEHPVVVFCQEGYASSFAAASLLDVGLRGATDLDGGFAAWKAAGLRVTEPNPEP